MVTSAYQDGVTDAELTERFGPVFARIAAGAVEREADRRLPFDEVEQLRAAGFTRIRVPRSHGGLGATLPQFFGQLIELGRADSNLPQLLRGHFAFVETRLALTDPELRDRWLHRLSSGVLVGNAQSEQGSSSFWENETSISRAIDADEWRLTGRKFYSTGSLFADWILTTASLDREHSATVLVPTSVPGVARIDDWDGFGQRLTGSGTTIFDEVAISFEDVEVYPNGELPATRLTAFYQLIHLAALSGIGLRAVDDAVAFVRQRTRNLANPAYPAPKDDPQVQEVIGRIRAASFAAVATTLAAVDALEGSESYDDAEIAAFSAQHQVIALVLDLTNELFEVGGSSAVTERFRLDRHWRNARTLASHNPVLYRTRLIGVHALDGIGPSADLPKSWRDVRDRRDRP